MSGATGDPGKGFDIMDACGDSEEDVLLPAQEPRQHRTIQGSPHEGLAARARSLPEEVLDGGEGSAAQAQPLRRAVWTRRDLRLASSGFTRPFSMSPSLRRCLA